MRKTVTQDWKLRLVFNRGHEEIVDLPARLSAKSAWRWIHETYYPRQPAIHVLVRGHKQLKS